MPERGLDYQTQVDGENRRRIVDLLGEEYDAVEVQDYIGYFAPERLKQELDILEKKITVPNTHPNVAKDIRKMFKEHLRYLSTHWDAAREAVRKL